MTGGWAGSFTCCCLFSSLLAMMASILSRSEAEHRDWEMETRSDGCGRTKRSPLPSWYWEQARWNEDTAMQDKCFGWACNVQSVKSFLLYSLEREEGGEGGQLR